MPSTPLASILADEIARRGPIPFPDFMAQALYHPEHGYYTSGRARIGREGDFFTNVSVGALFGRLLARQFAEVWERLGRPAPFTIVEQGAHRGDFAHDALLALVDLAPECAATTDYCIIEPSPALRAAQRERLLGVEAALSRSDVPPPSSAGEGGGDAPAAGRIEAARPSDRAASPPAVGFPRWCELLAALAPFTGIHFSNELLDAFPIHVVKWTGTEWRERFVTTAGDGFAWTDGELSRPDLRERLALLPPVPPGYITEVNLAALDWLDALAARLVRGCVLAIDYGLTRAEYYRPERITGTLTAYAQHRRVPDPLARPGTLDITAHIEFTSLIERAAAHGLTHAGLTDQHHFMVGLGRLHFPDAHTAPDAAQQRELRAFQTLMHPTLMGRSFKALCLAKDLTPGAPLAGFTFARS